MSAFLGSLAWLAIAYGVVRLGVDGVRAVRAFLNYQQDQAARLRKAQEQVAEGIARARAKREASG